MADLKHVGRIKATGKKCLVVFRTLPGDAYNCLIVPTENLPDDQHDAIIQLVESPASQSSYEFGEVMARAKFPDGSTMLPALHVQGKLIKVPTDAIEMTPNFNISVNLSELNQIIAEQRGVAVDDLSIKQDIKETKNTEVKDIATIKDISNIKDSTGKTTSASITEETQPAVENLTPEEQAKHFRSEADRLSKQAAEMRRKAESLVPVKKTVKVKTSA